MVHADPTAPSKRNVLALTDPKGGSRDTFNLAWTDQVRFEDGRLSLRFKAVSGRVDQGGGPIWRAQDRANYYICRANPLEDNVRLYYVKNAARQQLASADVTIAPDTWHTLTIEHAGNHIVCSFNGKTRLDVTDDTFSEGGGVGLWTKADAATIFDDLQMKASD